FIGPKLREIAIEQIGQDARSRAHIFKFTVDEVLNRKRRKFRSNLLAALNLLQENVGNHGVFESNASEEEYLRTLYVNWEILHRGEREENLRRILSVVHSDDPQVRERI